MEEKEVSLLDVFVELLLHWRGMLICMLAGGIVFGALGYVRNTQNYQSAQNYAEPTEADLKSGLTEVQISNVETTLAYEKVYEDKAEYRDKSVLMEIDANSVPTIHLLFLVKAENGADTDWIAEIYKAMATDGGLYQYLVEGQEELDSEMVSELVSLKEDKTNNMKLNSDGEVVNMIVNHSDEEKCKLLAQKVIDYFEQQSHSLQGTVGSHSVLLLSESYSMVVDADLRDYQEKLLANILSALKTVADRKAGFSEGERQYYNYRVSMNHQEESGTGESDAKEEIIQEIPAPRISVKYIVVGVALSAFAYLFVLFLSYILGNKLKATDDLSALYGIPCLGQIAKTGDKKKWLSFIDDKILSLVRKRKVSEIDTNNLVAASIKLAAKKEGIDEIYLIGCNLPEKTQSICNTIQQTLNNVGIKVKILNNVQYDPEAMKQLEDVQGVVLVETARTSLYMEIAGELELMKRQGIKVLGGVMVV